MATPKFAELLQLRAVEKHHYRREDLSNIFLLPGGTSLQCLASRRAHRLEGGARKALPSEFLSAHGRVLNHQLPGTSAAPSPVGYAKYCILLPVLPKERGENFSNVNKRKVKSNGGYKSQDLLSRAHRK